MMPDLGPGSSGEPCGYRFCEKRFGWRPLRVQGEAPCFCSTAPAHVKEITDTGVETGEDISTRDAIVGAALACVGA